MGYDEVVKMISDSGYSEFTCEIKRDGKNIARLIWAVSQEVTDEDAVDFLVEEIKTFRDLLGQRMED